MEYHEIIDIATTLGIRNLNATTLLKYESQSDGLSGGISRIYTLFNRVISCHKAGVVHDYLYDRGGTKEDRKQADRLFRIACTKSGKPVPGWLQKLRREFPKIAWLFLGIPPLRRFWRWLRAWGMYWAVRWLGRTHWQPVLAVQDAR